MTIDELLALTGLTGSDEIPVWDEEASGEPTKKITAQNFAAAVKTLASLLGTGDVVNDLDSTNNDKPLSANMGKTLNDKFSTVLEWVRVANEESTAGADFDKTVSVSIPSAAKEVMFTIQRVSNGRTIASSIIPFQQFSGAAIYAIGSYQIFGNAISSLGNLILINAVCINLGNEQIEIACTCANINESLRFRVFYR